MHACIPHIRRSSKKIRVFCFRDLDSVTACRRFPFKTVVIIQLLLLQPGEAKDTECPASKQQTVQFPGRMSRVAPMISRPGWLSTAARQCISQASQYPL